MGKFSNTTTFSGLLERATSLLQLEPDWASILQICDCVRQQDVSPKFAVSSIKKKIFDRNPHVSKFALTVLEACVKNCGSVFHDEIGTKDFMEDMRNLIKTGPEPVKETALGLIQTWSHAFRNESKYKIIQDTFNLMKLEGCQFPAFKESDAMFSADCAPAWAEGEVCHMCRVKFGTFIRQHHCRKCGQVFCKKCSSKESIIPQFGIEREVRVCDPCFFNLNPQSKTEKSEAPTDPELPTEYLNSSLSKELQVPEKVDAQQLKEQEEEELQLAMALSLSQEEAAKDKKPVARSWASSSSSSANAYSSNPASRNPASSLYSTSNADHMEADSSEMDPDLARYLNRSYWEGRREQQTSGYTPPSAPAAHADDRAYSQPAPYHNATAAPAPYSNHAEQKQTTNWKKKKRTDQKLKEKSNLFLERTSDRYAVEENEANEIEQSSETLVNNFQGSIEMLADRMQTISGKGKHIAMDATVQSLFQTVSAMHPQLLRMIEQQKEETERHEALQDRLGLVKEARVTLEGTREQHREKARQQELEQDMLRRMQIEQKLELMRQQKAEYMAYQQRLQTERQMALEQQHQQLRYQKYNPQQYAGEYVVADGGSPYPSMGYMPGSTTAPSGVAQSDGSPYSSMNYVPPSGVQTSTLPGLAPPGGPPGYAPQRYAGMDENTRSQSPQFGVQPQHPPSYSQAEYAAYGSETTDGQSLSNGHTPTQHHQSAEYMRMHGPEIPNAGYQPSASQPHPAQPVPQQHYVSPPSSAPSLPQVQPPQYAQATNQHLPQHQQNQAPQYEASQQFLPQQGSPQVPASHQPQQMNPHQQPPPMQGQYPQTQQHPAAAQQPDPSGFPHPQMQGQPQSQTPHGNIPGGYAAQQQVLQQPQQQLQQPPQQLQQPPQQLQQPQLQQPQQLPHHQQQPQQHAQQIYEPQPQQYQSGTPYANQQQPQQPNQYYHQQPSGPPLAHRQLSDLELISFD